MKPEGRPFDADHRTLTVGVLLSITVVAFQSMGIVTVLPVAARELDGIALYGWAVTGFMLASILGAIAAGRAADARGHVAPYAAAGAAFCAGSALAAAAPSWWVLLAGRVLQGVGVGAITAMSYVAIARGYDERLRSRMLAIAATAWLVPSLAGPALSGVIADEVSWRWVFLALLPALALAAALAVPALRTLDARVRGLAAAPEGAAHALPALALVCGVGTLVAALSADRVVVGSATALAGGALGLWALRRLVPAGTLRARRGLPAALAVRGVMAGSCLGVEAFVLLTLTEVYHLGAGQAGVAVTAGAVTWTIGAWAQARLDAADGGVGRARRIVVGAAQLGIGLTIMAASVVWSAPLGVLVCGWTVAGFGMGLVYPSAAAAVFAAAPDGEEGGVSGSMQLLEMLAVATVAGVAGALVALAPEHAPGPALAGALGIGAALAFAGSLVGRRVVPAPGYVPLAMSETPPKERDARP